MKKSRSPNALLVALLLILVAAAVHSDWSAQVKPAATAPRESTADGSAGDGLVVAETVAESGSDGNSSTSGPSGDSVAPRGLARFAGESIRFRVTWAGLPVARATLSVVPDEDGAFRMRAHTKTRSVVRWIYPVDSVITSIVHNPGFSAVYYSKTGKEGWGKNPQREVHFDHKKGQSSYIRNGIFQRSLEIPADVLDPLSVLYYFRTLKNIADEEVEINVCDGKRLITGVVKPAGRERLKTPVGTFDTIIVEPVMEGIGGVFKKSPGATLLVWLTDDGFRRPVKIKSDVAVGSFTALAVEIVAPEPPAPALK